MNHNKIFSTALLALIILIAAGCLHTPQPTITHSKYIVCDPKTLRNEAKTMTPTITVFIHGTRIFPKFYAQELFYSPDGLKNITEIEQESHMHTIAKTLEQKDPQRFTYENFYTFGWNGLLDFTERKKAAENLYKTLKDFSLSYFNQHGSSPRIRLITHSHGGNVALNLALVAQEVGDNKFNIAELILLACPVQEKTKHLSSAALFEKIYSLSSHNDFLQIIDPQGLHQDDTETPLFSERRFPAHQHLLQADIKLSGFSPLHIEFLTQHFFTKLPTIINAMDNYHTTLQESGKTYIIDVHDDKIKIYKKK